MNSEDYSEIDDIAAAAEARVLSTNTTLNAEEREIDKMVMKRVDERFDHWIAARSAELDKRLRRRG